MTEHLVNFWLNAIKNPHFKKKTSRDRPKSTPYPRLKNSKDFQVSINSTRKSKNKNNGPSGAPGPASASPWRAKRGTLTKLSTFLSQLKGGPFWEKNKFSKKKSHNAEKLKGGLLEIFEHPICCKISKKLKGEPFREKKIRKVSQCRKTERGDTLGFFNIHSVLNIKKVKWGKIFIFGKKSHSAEKNWDFPTSILTQNSKKIEGGHFEENFFPKKSLAVPKKIERGDPLVSPSMVCHAENPFWFSWLGQMVQ